jgi:hypothetical protein
MKFFVTILLTLSAICSASVRKCGYPAYRCLCDMKYGTIFCGQEEMTIFPVFPSYIRNYTSEIRVVNTGISSLPDFSSWNELKKIVLKANDNLICRDILKIKEMKPIAKVISNCNDSKVIQEENNTTSIFTTVSSTTVFDNEITSTEEGKHNTRTSSNTLSTTVNFDNNFDTSHTEDTDDITTSSIHYNTTYEIRNTAKNYTYNQNDVEEKNDNIYIIFGILGSCMILLVIVVIFVITYIRKYKSSHVKNRNVRPDIKLDDIYTFEEETAV